MIAVHGPSILETLHLVQLLSSGYVNFIQVYDVLNGFIFTSEFDKNMNLMCHMSQTHFPVVEPLETFFHNLGVLFVSCLSVGEVHPESMKSLYRRPVKGLFAEYLANRPPPAVITWLNLYLERIRSKIFSMDNLLHKFVTPEGQEGYGLYIASILDNIYKFGGKHNRYKYHRMWASSNCSIETVCASAMVIYKHVLSENIDFGAGAVERMCTVLPLVNTTHSVISWLPSPMSLPHIG